MDAPEPALPHVRLALVALVVAVVGLLVYSLLAGPRATAPEPDGGQGTPSSASGGDAVRVDDGSSGGAGGADTATDASRGTPASAGEGDGADAVAERLRPQVLASYPHDPTAFTQGLLWYEGQLLESTGLNGRSSLRRVDLESGQVLQQVPVPEQYFAEGLALVGESLYQLTWQSHAGFRYRLADLAPEGGFTYEGEGWGLCYDGQRLVRSDGSADLIFHRPEDFAELGRVTVTLDGAPQERLNELECVGGQVYANVWQTDRILRIDPVSGRVGAEIDASGLLSAAERQGADVLNGIAFNPQAEVFYITGKLWPKLFEVRFAP